MALCVGRVSVEAEGRNGWCARHDAETEGESPSRAHWRESDVKSSCTRWRTMSNVEPVRACGMEARNEAQHRMKMNPCAGRTIWASAPTSVTPDFQSRTCGSGGGGGAKFLRITLGDLFGSAICGRPGRKVGTMSGEKSDRLIVALKPSNAGGAKGATS